jgi:hypothetical protein
VTLHRRGIRREDVLAGLAAAAVSAYRAALWPVLVSDGSGAERLERALVALCAVAEEQLEVLVALQAAADEVFHAAGEGAVDTRTEFTEPLEKLLRDGVADGSLHAEDPHETAVVLFNMVGGTYVHLRSGHRWPAPRAQSAVIATALRGVERQSVSD